jgi:hypothetical protein
MPLYLYSRLHRRPPPSYILSFRNNQSKVPTPSSTGRNQPHHKKGGGLLGAFALLLPMVKAVREREEALMLVYCAYTLNEQPNVPHTHLEYQIVRFHLFRLICFLILWM